MACDRIIRWDDPAKKPTTDVVRMVLEDYLGDATWVSLQNHNWLMATLPGPSSFPFKRLPDMGRWAASSVMHTERWFEVCCIEADSIDVMTRQADEFTMTVAQGFADLLARFFGGKIDPM